MRPGNGPISAPVLRLLYWEGAFAMVYDTWIGPTYLSGLAGELEPNLAPWVFEDRPQLHELGDERA